MFLSHPPICEEVNVTNRNITEEFRSQEVLVFGLSETPTEQRKIKIGFLHETIQGRHAGDVLHRHFSSRCTRRHSRRQIGRPGARDRSRLHSIEPHHRRLTESLPENVHLRTDVAGGRLQINKRLRPDVLREHGAATTNAYQFAVIFDRVAIVAAAHVVAT